jgi:N-acetylglucosaminyl-diphospho-decaprenol L-rhamnosyltransferase
MPPSDTCSISVVFVSYNSAQTIGAAIHSVKQCLPDAEIIVVDNGSTDETCRIVQQSVSTDLLEGHGNIGFGAGVNLGARAASGDLLIVLNPDAAIVHATVERLHDLARRSRLGMIGCLLRDERHTRYLKYSEWGWRRELGWMIVQWFLVPRELNLRRPSPRLRKSRLWISGAAFLVNRSEFLNLGGFDEEIFLYCEDVDLSRRYREHGAGVGTTDALVVTHTGQGSGHGAHEQIQGWALLSFLELVAKWHERQDGERAARAALRTLDALSEIARIAGALPFVGRRAIAKAHSAAVVRSTLLDCVENPPVAGVYPRARAAVAAVTQGPRSAGAR